MALKKFRILLALSVLIAVGNIGFWVYNGIGKELKDLNIRQEIEDILPDFEIFKDFEMIESSSKQSKVDWNDYMHMRRDSERAGPGEQGKPVTNTTQYDQYIDEEVFKIFGVSPMASQKISVNRSIPDSRTIECKVKRYSEYLPPVSIVLVLYKEVISVLMRTLHSLYNRTPIQLVREIILIYDNKSLAYEHTHLDEYIRTNFQEWDFKIFDTEIGNPMTTGSMEASSNIVVFINSHLEFGYNWLPPLIEPLVDDEFMVTTPIMDSINNKDFGYVSGEPVRGAFNWYLKYKELPYEMKKENLTVPYSNPIMKQSVFAIKKYFIMHLEMENELMQFESMEIENIQRSLKIWLCGGRLLTVPCSHVGYIDKKFPDERTRASKEYLEKKLLAEVWLEEYKQTVYMRNPDKYANIDVGDLTAQQEFRKSCQEFRYFMDNVAPDMIMKYPPIVDNIASGSVRLAKSGLCLDSVGSPGINGKPIGLRYCKDTNNASQLFSNTWFLDLRQESDMCVDAITLTMAICNSEKGAQRFRYYKDTGLIKSLSKTTCLEAKISKKSVTLEKCDEFNNNQRWQWTTVSD